METTSLALRKTTDLKTRTSPPSLSERLHALLLSGESPIIGPVSAAELRTYIEAHVQPAYATQQDVDHHVGLLSLATKERRPTPAEANARIELHWSALKGCTRVDLARGTQHLVNTMTFMPTPAELRASVRLSRAKREYPIGRASYLVMLHERQYVAPIEPANQLTVEGFKQFRQELAAIFPTEREGANA